MNLHPLFFDTFIPSLDHLRLIYEWKRDIKTLKHSFSQNLKSFPSFQKEYKNKFHSIEKAPPKWIIYQGQKVGLLYFEEWFKENGTVLSIFLDPQFQNQKIGPIAIKKAITELTEIGFKEIIAFVKPENIRAKKAFEEAGFSFVKSVQVPKYDSFFKADKYSFSTQKKRETFIIAEIGSNFSLGDEKNDLKLAKTLMEQAYSAGCSAAKFQLFNPQKIYVPNAGKAGYLNDDINEIFVQYALPPSFIPKLFDHAEYLGIELMCSFFSEEDFEVINPYVQRHKIASYEIRHLRLLELAAKSSKPLFLSTGAATLKDIEWAVNTFYKNGGKEITLFHCTARYPAEADSLNLKCIQTLKERFNLPVGFSDHSEHPLYAPIIAVSLGALAIEKHITLHQKLPGPDNFFSINTQDLKVMCAAIEETENILGVAKKEIFPQEEELAAFARRGLQAIKPIKVGDLLKEDENIAILRPGEQKLGIHPKYLGELEGKKAVRDIPLGQGLQHEDVLW